MSRRIIISMNLGKAKRPIIWVEGVIVNALTLIIAIIFLLLGAIQMCFLGSFVGFCHYLHLLFTHVLALCLSYNTPLGPGLPQLVWD
jgi:hypothetical protein